MSKKDLLLSRLSEIGQSLENTGKALALLGLGSVGTERARLDDYSDLDFFAIVKPGNKHAFIEDLAWLSCIRPIAYAFKNSADGYKLLFDDRVFCEFAVFEQQELAAAAFSEGMIVWKEAGFDETVCVPKNKPAPQGDRDLEWIKGEAITNLYVGLCRYHRGERLSAFRFVESYAVDRVVEICKRIEPEQPALRDIFTAERRFESRFPETSKLLMPMMQGYDRVKESALAVLAFFDKHFGVNPAMKEEIEKLCR